jgi:hypothetical protein
VRVAGTLHRVTASPRGGGPALRAELGGGSEPVTIVWLGREHIPGIEPGRPLTVEGRLTRQRGRTVIYNPRYELAAGHPATPGR